MPPKVRFTREEIIRAALDITRESGPEALTARSLAARLDCSAKPIFGLFRSMDEVQQEVLKAGYQFYGEAIARAMESGEYPPYKASGMAYIDFARREKHLFRLLFMRNRSQEEVTRQLGDDAEPLLDLIQRAAGISRESARMFHLEMWIYVHGIASMAATSFLDWDTELISASLTDVYMGVLARFKGKGGAEMNAIEIQGLTKRYGPITAVDGLDLTVRQGELFALLGVNGAGKTTTIKMLSCLTRPDSGDARLLGRSVVTDTAAVKNCIGVSPQETAVAPNLTARENLLLMCGVHGLPRQESLARVEELARTLGLEPVLARRAGKLSGGWQRRLSIAMALVARPEILFLDEPTLGLDVLARAELWDVIRALKGRITVILTTHYMEEAEALSDRVGVMKDGRLLALGTPEELKVRTGCEKFEDAFIAIVKGAGK